MSNSFNLNKAKFGYLLYSELNGLYKYDNDFVLKFKVDSTPYIFEVKHPNDRCFGLDGQARYTLNDFRDDAVYVVCVLDCPVDTCLLVDGLITQDRRDAIETKIPYLSLDDCTVKQIFTKDPKTEEEFNKNYKGMSVKFMMHFEKEKYI